jgi:DNA mismatch endonuclease (patch repair protein)
MSCIKSKGTKPEKTVGKFLRTSHIRFTSHKKALPGKPDFVLKDFPVAIFVDGDFWHGRYFPRWKNRLLPYWQEKISKNTKRDLSTFRKLRYLGFKVLRIWESHLDRDSEKQFKRILLAIQEIESKSRLRSSSATALKTKDGRGNTKTKEKIGANKTLHYGSSANTATNSPFDAAGGVPPLAFGKLPSSESGTSCRKLRRAG